MGQDMLRHLEATALQEASILRSEIERYRIVDEAQRKKLVELKLDNERLRNLICTATRAEIGECSWCRGSSPAPHASDCRAFTVEGDVL